MSTCAARQDWRYHVCHVGVEEDSLIIEQGLRGLHHLVQHKQVLHIVGNLLCNEAQQVGCELVDTWLCPDCGKRCVLPLNVGLVSEGARQLGKELLGLLGQHVLDERLDVDIVETVCRRQMRVSIRTLGQQIGVVRCRVLRYRRLDAFNSKPVR
jgi:hypothetical protein